VAGEGRGRGGGERNAYLSRHLTAIRAILQSIMHRAIIQRADARSLGGGGGGGGRGAGRAKSDAKITHRGSLSLSRPLFSPRAPAGRGISRNFAHRDAWSIDVRSIDVRSISRISAAWIPLGGDARRAVRLISSIRAGKATRAK